MFVGYTTSSGYCGHASIKWPKSIKMICVIPTELRLSTELARNVLPVSYSRADVVSNIQRLAVLVATLASINAGGPIDRKLIHESLSDCIHQPYRMSLVPGLEHMVRDLMPETTPGLLGIVLSGAGPTVLALATENFDNIGELMVKIFQDNGVKAKYLLLEVEDGGAKIETSE